MARRGSAPAAERRSAVSCRAVKLKFQHFGGEKMKIYPAIDIIGGEAVRLYKGDYDQKTVYGDPCEIAKKFKASGALQMHVVDLEGAKTGGTPNIETIKKIIEATDMFIELGGGIRSMDVIDAYLAAGVSRVILGTAAVKDKALLCESVAKYGEKIAVGVDILDGMVRINGWLENSGVTLEEFLSELQVIGVKTVICTDISKDGAMQGTNRELYKKLSRSYDINIIASGGVSSIEDIKALKEMGLYGAIVGKACYTGAIDLSEAIEVAK